MIFNFFKKNQSILVALIILLIPVGFLTVGALGLWYQAKKINQTCPLIKKGMGFDEVKKIVEKGGFSGFERVESFDQNSPQLKGFKSFDFYKKTFFRPTHFCSINFENGIVEQSVVARLD
jgi:hypothetical protein